ncbi:TetR/AcrR family transcriptional regulator [Metapseudomonas furukawaii]|jgi:AcrR family transcriptional regulator|uniref:TetR/AcrR family transcriptional regulator n=1 Tax=Metapseudomonas furukawaii TaxID=1149133 RepID=UPI000684D86E|nr:TetR/AcrR family transcriptional regulator [Pseudomonas furukawaii]
MNVHPVKRLPKFQRRDQLLGAALVMLREQGTEELTLCSLAQRVGITHTVVYRHFETRTGLLIALYERVDAYQIEVLLSQLKLAAPQLKQVANAVSDAYMSGAIAAGVEWQALQAALKGNEEMSAVLHRQTEAYAAICQNALTPFSHLPPDQLHVRCMGLLGAARAIAEELISGRIDQAKAVNALTALIMCWLIPAATHTHFCPPLTPCSTNRPVLFCAESFRELGAPGLG